MAGHFTRVVAASTAGSPRRGIEPPFHSVRVHTKGLHALLEDVGDRPARVVGWI
jgi:hypothetical protein